MKSHKLDIYLVCVKSRMLKHKKVQYKLQINNTIQINNFIDV